MGNDRDYQMDFEDFDTDFTDTEPPERTPVLPAGTYPAIVDDVVKDVGQTSGEPYLHVTFRITHPDFEGVRIHDRGNFSFSPKAKPFAKARLEMILGAEIPRGPFRLADYYDRLVGRPVQLRLKVGSYNGEPKNEVERIIPTAAIVAPNNPKGKSGSLF